MDYGGNEGGVSLAVKLMQVAGEFEMGVKRDKQRLENRINQLTERNAELERQQKKDAERIDSLTKMVQVLQLEVEKSSSSGDEKLQLVETELMQTRFNLHERTSQLLEVLSFLLKLDATTLQTHARLGIDSENIDPQGRAQTKGDDASEVVLQRCTSLHVWSNLSAAVESLSMSKRFLHQFSRAAFFEGVRQGKMEVIDGILRPSSTLHKQDAEDTKENIDRMEMINEAFITAVKADQVIVCKKLLQAGASAKWRTKDGSFQNSLHVAASLGHDAVVKLLIGKELIEVDAQDAYNRTALHLAAVANSGAIVKLLLLNGADPTAADFHGHTPTDLAHGFTKADVDVTRTPCFVSGELQPNAPAPAAQAVLEDPNVLFWNASLRANKYYGDKRFEKAISAYTLALETVTKCQNPASPRDLATLHYNRARAQYRLGNHCAAIDDCAAALNHDPLYRNALAQRAECFMSVFDFDRAVKDFQALLETDPVDKQWTRRLMDATSMRDMSHYGILGVRRDADAAALKKAYRALCLRWHPDKHSDSPEDVARAHTAFKRINDAYEVLNDSYKRMMYDIDPKSRVGVPMESKSSYSTKGATNEGFDKWYSHEQERVAERDKEREATRLREAIQRAREEAERKSARSTHKSKLVSLASSNGSKVPTEAKHGIFTRMAVAATSSMNTVEGSAVPRALSAQVDATEEQGDANPLKPTERAPDMSEDEVASQVAATAARARAAVAQAEAFVKLVQAHSSAAERVSAMRPTTAQRARQSVDPVESGRDLPGYVAQDKSSAAEADNESDVDADSIEDPYAAYLRKVGKVDTYGLSQQDLDEGSDGHAYSGDGDISFDDEDDIDDFMYDEHAHHHDNDADESGHDTRHIPSLAELEAELEGLTAEALAAATAARERHASANDKD